MLEQRSQRYHLLSLLGRGGMGSVYLAEDRVSGERVALKTLDLTNPGEAEDAVLRFKQEFRGMSRFRHPGVVAVHDFGNLDDGTPFFTMEVVDGKPLDAELPLPHQQVREILTRITAALEAVHLQGLVHGDIKAENLFLTSDGGVKLMDFGLMTPAGQPSPAIQGTLAYMAPEIARRDKVDPRTDLYALGVLAHLLLSGRYPFAHEDPVQMLRAHLEELPVPVAEQVPDLPTDLAEAIDRLLAKDPLERFQTGRDLQVALGTASFDDDRPTLFVAPLIGRAAVLDQLDESLTRLTWGQAAPLALVGKPGIGKSRLLDELVQRAQVAGVQVLRGRGGEEAQPYALFGELLAPLWAALSPEEQEPRRDLFSMILPGVSAPGSLEAVDPRVLKSRLQAAVVDLIRSGVDARPTVLIVDDWHLADTGSVELLAEVERSVSAGRLMVVRAGREPLADAIDLGSLDGEACLAFIGAVLGTRDVSAAFADRLTELTEGNPQFLDGALRHLVESGKLLRRSGRWLTEGLQLEPADLPGDYRDLLVQRLGKLGPDALLLLRVVVLHGRRLPVSRARAVLAWSEEQVLDAVEALERESVLRSLDGGLEVAGGHVAAAVEVDWPAPERAMWCGRVAEAIREGARLAGNERSREVLFDLARLGLVSDDPARGVEPALLAARMSFSLGAPAQAYKLAEQVAPHVREASDRLAMLHVMGDALRSQSQLDQAQDLYQQALGLADELGDRVQAATILTSHAILHQIRSRFDEALVLLDAGLNRLEGLPNQPAMRRLWLRRAMVTNFAGDVRRAIESGETALALAREAQDQWTLSSALGQLGIFFVQSAPERMSEGLAYLVESRGIKESLGDRIGLNEALNLLGNAHMRLGHYPEALDCFARTVDLCVDLGIRDDELCAYINMAMACHEHGRLDQAIAHGRLAALGARETGNALYEGYAWTVAARAAGQAGRLGEAFDLLAEAETVQTRSPSTYLEVLWSTIRAEVLLAAGRLVEAQEFVDAAGEAARRTGIDEFEPQRMLAGLELLIRFREYEAARQESVRLSALFEQQSHRGPALRLEALAATLAWFEKRHDSVRTIVDRALPAALERGMQPVALQLVTWLALSELREQGPAAARRALETIAPQDQATPPAVPVEVLHRLAWALSETHPARKGQQLSVLRERVLAMAASIGSHGASDDWLGLEEFWHVLYGAEAWVRGSRVVARGDDGTVQALQQELEAVRSRLESLSLAHDNLQQLVQWGTETHGATDLVPLLETVVQMTVTLLGAERGFYVVRHEAGLTFRASTVDPRERNPRAWQFVESAVHEAFRTGELQILSDASTLREAAAVGVCSLAAVPLRDRAGAVFAVVYADWRVAVPTERPGTVELLGTFASQAAQAIHNCQIAVDSADQSHRLEMLNNLARTVSTTLVLASVLDLVADFTLKLTKADRVFVLLSETGDHLRCHLARDRHGNVLTESEKVSGSITQRVLATQEAECVLDTHGHATLQAQQSILDLNLRSVMCVPLTVSQDALGVLYVDSQVVVNAFSERDLDFLKAIASQAAVAIQNAKLYERATVDALTRLFVRSYFEQKLGVELRRSLRYGSSLSVLMMDIDHFKKFNDTYGHATGDDVLRLVAEVIRENIRELDVPARFGGEEMLVLMPETDLEGAMVVAERLRLAIASTPLPGPDGATLSVNVSIGVATVPDHASTPVELVELADQALYVSKRSGRNRVTSASALAASPEPAPS
jgi:diguanylate cyclase (GGDEF)-like protein